MQTLTAAAELCTATCCSFSFKSAKLKQQSISYSRRGKYFEIIAETKKVLNFWVKFGYNQPMNSAKKRSKMISNFHQWWILVVSYHIKRGNNRYLKNNVSKSVVHGIKHVNFQLYNALSDGIYLQKLTTEDKYMDNRVWLFPHRIMCF